MDTKFYTTAEVAQMLKVHRTTVIGLIKTNKLVATIVGTQYRISFKHFEEYLDRNTRELGGDANQKSTTE